MAQSSQRKEPPQNPGRFSSAIAGLVAAHNRSDGGMGAMFKATLEYQRVLARQLDSLQQGMADLLSKVNGLPKEIQSQLYAERLSRLHTTLGAAVLRYRQEAIVRASTFASYQAWLANDNTRNALVAILGDVDRAIAEVVQGRWIDASTCMYLPAVLYTSLGVRAALGDRPEQLMAEAQRVLDIFDLMDNPAVDGSVAADSTIRAKRLASLGGDLALRRFTVPTNDAIDPREVFFGQVAIQDYAPRTLVKEDSACRPRKLPGGDWTEVCIDTSIWSPERVGPRERFGYFAKVSQVFMTNGGNSSQFAFRQFTVEPQVTTRRVADDFNPNRSAGAPAVAAQNNSVFATFGAAIRNLGLSIATALPARAERADASTPEARLEAANKSEEKAAAVRAHAEFVKLIDSLNSELAFQSLNAAALVAIAVTRQGVMKYFGRES